MTTQKAKVEGISARDLKNLHIFLENSAGTFDSRKERCWGYTSIYENKPKKLLLLHPKSYHNLVVQGRVQLEH